MVKCSICEREFRNDQGLRAHIGHAHSRKKGDNAPPPAVIVLAQAEKALPDGGASDKVVKNPMNEAAEEESVASRIRDYLGKGYSFVQLTKQFGFDPRSVHREIEKMVPPEGNDLPGKADPGDDGLPVTRKTGGGAEITTPEAILKYYMTGGDPEKYELRGMMKLRAAMLMVMDLVNIQKAAAEADAKRLEPVLRLMKETREEQDAAAARAKSSSFEIAREAAHEAVGGVLGYIEEKIPKGPPPKTVDEAYTKRMDKVMDMMWGVMEQQMFPGRQGGTVPEGWETEQKKGGE